MTNKLTKIFVESDQPNTYNIFVDMDGTITDIDTQFEKYAGEPLEGFEERHGKEAFWSFPDKAGSKFWSEMPWMPDGQELWNYVLKYNPTILSAPSRHQSCQIGKTEWLKKNVKLPNYDVQLKIKGPWGRGWDKKSKIILNSEKFRYCSGPNDILIDDTPKKVTPWIQAGGIGILHKSAAETISKLKELGL
jgi:hypothetical protein